MGVLGFEGFQFSRVFREPGRTAAFLLFLFFAAYLDIPLELVPALVAADVVVFVLAEFHRAQSRIVLRVGGDLDQIFRVDALRQRRIALGPDLGDVGLPTILHALDVSIRAAEQQHFG